MVAHQFASLGELNTFLATLTTETIVGYSVAGAYSVIVKTP